jgi:hypothetical protein
MMIFNLTGLATYSCDVEMLWYQVLRLYISNFAIHLVGVTEFLGLTLGPGYGYPDVFHDSTPPPYTDSVVVLYKVGHDILHILPCCSHSFSRSMLYNLCSL